MLSVPQKVERWGVRPDADQYQGFAWEGGVFETARRRHTDFVEGTISSCDLLVMATLNGGARRHEFATDEGFRYSGAIGRDASICQPAAHDDCGSGTSWEWAAIALPPRIGSSPPERPFSVERDDFLYGVLAQFRANMLTDGALDVTYCDTMDSPRFAPISAIANVVRKGRPSNFGSRHRFSCEPSPTTLMHSLQVISALAILPLW